MSQKRKPSTSTAASPEAKVARNTETSKRRFKTAAKPVSLQEEELSADDDDGDAFEGFGSSADEQDGSGIEAAGGDSESEESSDDSEEDVENEEGDELDQADEEEEMDQTVNGEETGGSSKTGTVKEVPAHAAQRALAKERKLSRPNGTLPCSLLLTLANKLADAKKIWESLRQQKGLSKQDRQTQVTELYNIISGDILSLVFGHSASRFVQTAMKYGSPEQRLTIAKELQGRYVELAKAKYGKFLVAKILEYGYVNLERGVLIVEMQRSENWWSRSSWEML